MPYDLEDYFGTNAASLASQTRSSSEAPTPLHGAGAGPGGQSGSGLVSFTDWRHSPVFWLAVFSVFALGMIHAEGHVRMALR